MNIATIYCVARCMIEPKWQLIGVNAAVVISLVALSQFRNSSHWINLGKEIEEQYFSDIETGKLTDFA